MNTRNPPGERCPAKAKSTQRQCEKRVVGGGPCRWHGGAAPQVRAAREARLVAMRAQLAGEPWEPRPAYEVLEGAMTDADAVLSRIKAQLWHGHVDAATLDALHRWVELAAKISKTVMDAGIDERRVRLAEAHGRVIEGVIRAVLDELLSRALRLLVFDGGELERAWPVWVGEVVPRELRAAIEGGGRG